MAELQEILQRLAKSFVARDIMVPVESLACADDKTSAMQRLEENPRFDVIPIRQRDFLIAFYERNGAGV